ncbi:hypothetical protein Q8A67_025153 [Cirrhinus molitorella]|uniref:Uncharacterized protein n=1 Tax=Cirrhinus molitorella TaxID=172907 RepID=A0AA88NZ22_9TELE|nr:hypothetical protein Q8A67_025153 [Cirrhinus molitorella]
MRKPSLEDEIWEFILKRRIAACCVRISMLSDFIKNIFICVPKMSQGLTGLERHEAVWFEICHESKGTEMLSNLWKENREEENEREREGIALLAN